MGGTTASAGRSRKVCMAPSGNGTLESGPQRKLFGTPVMQCLLQDYDGHSAVGQFSIRFWVRNPNRNRFPQTDSDSESVTGVKFVRSALRNGSGRFSG